MTEMIPLPAGFDPASLVHMGKLDAWAFKTFGEHIESIDEDAWEAITAPSPHYRPEEEFVPTSIEAKELSGLELFYRNQHSTLVEWVEKPATGSQYAVVADVLPCTVALRNRVATHFGRASVRPSDFELQVLFNEDGEVGQVVVWRAPALDAEKRKEFWVKLISDLIPAVADKPWTLHDDTANAGTLTLSRSLDPLVSILEYPWSEPVDYTSIPLARREDGRPLPVGLYESNLLLGGIPGGGKSGGATAFLAGVSRLPNCALVGLDPKRVELSGWKPRFSMIAKKEEHAGQVLASLVLEMDRRYEWLDENGLKKLPLDRLDEKPLIVLMIDELADLVSVGVTKDEKAAELERSTAIRRLIAKGRAAGIIVVTATQKPQSDVIPTALRDLIQQRVAFATTTREMTDTILGGGMSLNGGLSHEISASQKGVAYVVNEQSRNPVRARVYWIPDGEVRSIAERTAHLRIELPWLPTEAQAMAAAAQNAVDAIRPSKPAASNGGQRF